MGKSIEKLVKAGIGAVTEGLNLTQDTIDRLAEKGEPLFNQARSSVSEAAEKIRQTVSNAVENDVCVDTVKHALAQLDRSQLLEIADYLHELIDITDAETLPPDDEDPARDCKAAAGENAPCCETEEKKTANRCKADEEAASECCGEDEEEEHEANGPEEENVKRKSNSSSDDIHNRG